MKIRHKSLSAARRAGFFALLIMLALVMTASVNAQKEIRESSFRTDGGDIDRYRLYDNDVIHLKMEKVPALAGKVEIVLKSSSNVTWWKGITLFKFLTDVSSRRQQVRLNHIDTQDDDHGPDAAIINVSDLGDTSYLSFEKAKAAGVHTPMYTFFLKRKDDKTFKYAGMRLTFTWERDG